jgi:hypothetical protein
MVLIRRRKLCINWHWPMMLWTIYRQGTWTAVGVGPLEIVWPRRGYWLPKSTAGC